MSSRLPLPVSGDPGEVWRVGYQPDPWQWTPWQYAPDDGRFTGRWDDQNAQFRTLYTSDSLLGCFLELLAPQRPNDTAYAELNEIEADGAAAGRYPDPERGAIGLSWLSGRMFARGVQTGTYAEITTAAGVAYLADAGVFDALGEFQNGAVGVAPYADGLRRARRFRRPGRRRSSQGRIPTRRHPLYRPAPLRPSRCVQPESRRRRHRLP